MFAYVGVGYVVIHNNIDYIIYDHKKTAIVFLWSYYVG